MSAVNMENSFYRRYQVSMVLLALTVCLALIMMGAPAEGRSKVALDSHPLSKRSFANIQCRGTYNNEMFSQLTRVCDDCFDLYREPEVHVLCRSNCFGSSYFKGCLDSLLLSDEEQRYDDMIESLGKK